MTDYFWREDVPWLVLQLPDGRRSAAPASWTDLPADTFPLSRDQPLLTAHALPPMARLCQRAESHGAEPGPDMTLLVAEIAAEHERVTLALRQLT